MKKKRLRLGTCVRLIIGVLFILGGICYFLYPNFREWRTQREVNTIIGDFEENRDRIIEDVTDGMSDSELGLGHGESEDSENKTHVPELSDEKKRKKKSDGADTSVSVDMLKRAVLPDLYNALAQYNQNLIDSGQQILDAWSYEQSPIDVELLNHGSSVIGYLEIPDMKVKLPLYLGASSDNLSSGAAVLSQTSMPIGGKSTNCVIAGHRGYRGSAFFQYIDRASVGSKVYVTNPWETLTYQVVGMKIVSPNQTDDVMIRKDRDMVTLVTCHPYQIGGGPERYLVFCERVYEEQSASDVAVVLEDESSGEDGNIVSEKQENPQQAVSDSKRDGKQVDGIAENELQQWERLLRIFIPMLVILIGCMLLFVHFAKKMRRKE